MDPSPVQPGPPTQATDSRSSQEKGTVVDDQPKASIPMTSNNVQKSSEGDRNAHKVPVSSDGTRSWSFGLLDCFSDLPTCALSTCCCCYVFGRNKRRLDHLEAHGTPLRERVEWCNRDCQCYMLFQMTGLGWARRAVARSGLRRRYGIRGNAVNDVLASGFCGACELVQEHREVQLEESSFY